MCGVPRRKCTGAAPPETEHSGVLSFQSIGARDVGASRSGKKTVRPDIKKKNGLAVPVGLSKNVSPDPPGPCYYARGRKKGCSGLGMKNQPVRPEKRLVSGLGEEKGVARPGGSQNAAM